MRVLENHSFTYMDSLNTTGLTALRSQEQLSLLDEIDALSRSGISEHVSLLTVVDLPGLIHGKNDDNEDDDVKEVVSELVQSYMCRPRTIVLAVVLYANNVLDR